MLQLTQNKGVLIDMKLCMKGNFFILKVYENNSSVNLRFEIFVVAFRIQKLFGTFKKRAPECRASTYFHVNLSSFEVAEEKTRFSGLQLNLNPWPLCLRCIALKMDVVQTRQCLELRMLINN